MTFPEQFEDWLLQAFAFDVPEKIKAFSFNLFEPAFVEGVKFGVEVIGTSEFSPDDQDWACEEIWEPKHRQLNIPVSFSGESWEQCLVVIQSLIEVFLAKDNRAAIILKSRLGIGVGFVDGDLNLVWVS